MYGLLLESINVQITEKYGKEVWQQILVEADLTNYVFVTHKLYSEDLLFKLADGVIKVIGEEEDMTLDDVMRLFGVGFVKFFNHYGYDPIIRVSGRHLRDFLIGIDNLHEHIRFGYPKMQSPTFYCDEETSSGLNLHYLSRRKGYMFYVIGQVEEIARKFYSTYDINIKILSNEREGSQCHIVYRLGFVNVGFKPPTPDLLCVQPKKSITVDVFFTIFPFSFVISTDMTISMAGNGLISTLGRKVLSKNVREVFTLRRPKTEFTWHSVSISDINYGLGVLWL
jgi:guanylate cyclase